MTCSRIFVVLLLLTSLVCISSCGGGDTSLESNGALPTCGLTNNSLPVALAGWTQVSANLPWGQRDAGATVSHQGNIWLLGGWTYDSNGARVLDDAWRSSDGLTWSRIDTPWDHGMYPMAVSFGCRIFYMGGMKDSRLPSEHISNEIWSSVDGETWKREIAAAEWEPRIGATLTEHNGALWIMGGKIRNSAEPDVFRNDVWKSSDGMHWQKVTDHAPWPARAFHCTVSHQGKLWMLGGGDWDSLVTRRDVWSSDDGINWIQHKDAPWEPRIWQACASFSNRIWVMGGRLLDPIRDSKEVWSTVDGEVWSIRSDFISPSERHAAYSTVHENRIWIIGGSGHEYMPSDVWQFKPEN